MSYGYLAQSVVAQVDRVLSRKLRPVLCDVLLRFGLRVGCASPLDGLRQDVSSLGVASESAVKTAVHEWERCEGGRNSHRSFDGGVLRCSRRCCHGSRTTVVLPRCAGYTCVFVWPRVMCCVHAAEMCQVALWVALYSLLGCQRCMLL